MSAPAARSLKTFLVVCACLRTSLGQGWSTSLTPTQLQYGQDSAQCKPACGKGVCKQAVNSTDLFCDCKGTGFVGPACNVSESFAASSWGDASWPEGCSPPCQHGTFCKQSINSGALYCDCSHTGYKGVACAYPGSTPSAGFLFNTSSSQNNASNPATAITAGKVADASLCHPACQNEGVCKKAISSGVYYCDCSHTAFKGASCSADQYVPAMDVVSNLSACSPPCKHGSLCKQEASSGVFYCDCQSTAYIGNDCSIPYGVSAGGAGAESTNAYGAWVGRGVDDRIGFKAPSKAEPACSTSATPPSSFPILPAAEILSHSLQYANGKNVSMAAGYTVVQGEQRLGILFIILACLAGLALIGFLGMLLMQRVQSSRAHKFTRFREEHFPYGAPNDKHGIEATHM